MRKGELVQTAISITPRRPMVIGRERLAHLARSASVNDVERDLIATAARQRARIVLLRAANDEGERRWDFDPDLSERELERAGAVMGRALLPLHRRLVSVGVMLMVHTEWSPRDCYTMRAAARTLIEERQGSRDPLGQLDIWLLENMLLYVSLGAGHITEKLLPSYLGAIERRLPRMGSILATLPPDSLA